jgi:hypothetical protein
LLLQPPSIKHFRLFKVRYYWRISLELAGTVLYARLTRLRNPFVAWANTFEM